MHRELGAAGRGDNQRVCFSRVGYHSNPSVLLHNKTELPKRVSQLRAGLPWQCQVLWMLFYSNKVYQQDGSRRKSFWSTACLTRIIQGREKVVVLLREIILLLLAVLPLLQKPVPAIREWCALRGFWNSSFWMDGQVGETDDFTASHIVVPLEKFFGSSVRNCWSWEKSCKVALSWSVLISTSTQEKPEGATFLCWPSVIQQIEQLF